MDKYLIELERIATDLEKLCGLSLLAEDGLPYGKLDVADVMAFCSEQVHSLPKESLKSLNTNIGRKVVLLSYLGSRLAYFGKKKLSYAEYPCMSEIARTLLVFTRRKTISDDSLIQLNKVIMIMDEIDHKDRTMRNTLGYRFLRLFMVIVMYGSYCNASVVASFILEQLIVREA